MGPSADIGTGEIFGHSTAHWRHWSTALWWNLTCPASWDHSAYGKRQESTAALIRHGMELSFSHTPLKQATHTCPVFKEKHMFEILEMKAAKENCYYEWVDFDTCFTFFGIWDPIWTRTAVCKHPAEVSRRWGFTVITTALGSELGSFLNSFLRDVNSLSWVLFVVLAEVSSVSKHKSKK